MNKSNLKEHVLNYLVIMDSEYYAARIESDLETRDVLGF
jgi:hypothetical protein